MIKATLKAATILAVALALPASAQEPKSYPLLCKGGGNNFTIRTAQVDNEEGVSVIWQFNKARTAATGGLRAGECAWTDRPLNGNEPSALELKFPNIYYLAVNYRVTDGQAGVIYQPSGSDSGRFNRIVQAIRSGGDLQFHAYNGGNDVLIVTRIGP